jgi:type III pantothenate kinase
MHFILDVGNTRIKWALFRKRELVGSGFIEPDNAHRAVTSMLDSHPIRSTLLATTGEHPGIALPEIELRSILHCLSYRSKLPFTNLYETPETLGVDRIGLVAAARLHYPDRPVLVIDAGSCVTFDLVDAEGNYLGGAISPGLKMRYRAMHDYTASLPLLEPDRPEDSLGRTTESSMHQGATGGLLAEIEATIDHQKKGYPNLTVVLTGGDAEFLRDSIKNDIFAHSNFLLEGLNYLLELNTI